MNHSLFVGSGRRILVAEDQEDARNSLQELLSLSLGLPVDVVADGAAALSQLKERPYSVLITDLRMPKLHGIKLIEAISESKIPVTVIVTTGHGGVADAVKAMRLGAYDFLVKPADPQHICLLVERALKERELQDEVLLLRQQLGDRRSFRNVLSKSPKMLEVFDLIGNVADTASTVLILGETGTGKEQVARALHDASTATRSGSFVAINCAALPENLLESELFGHEKGSFTGAVGQRKGRFEQAHLGTLFLDEVGDIPLPMQVKLLRVLQERRFERIGGSEPIEVDVRVIAATHCPLEQLVKEGKFREDLYYRLNVICIELPTLRDRPEDIPLLASHFTQKFARPGTTVHISPEAMEVLLKSPWPGNVRQLENAIERACVTARDGIIKPEHLPKDIGHRSRGKNHPLRVDLARPMPEQMAAITAYFEEKYIRKAMRKTQGHIGKCAKITGLSRRSITDKVAHYGIDKATFKGS